MHQGYFLETKRLGFRTWIPQDMQLALDLWGDIEVTKLIGGPFTEDNIKERVSQEIATMAKYGVQYWPIFLRTTGEHVGCCGLRPFKSRVDVLEIGFHIKRAYWGKGIAKEAALAVIDHAFGKLGAKELFAGHNPANEASARLLQKLQFRYTHEEYYQPTGINHPCYILTKDDFVAS